jgi:outer membrane protein TolC
LGISQKQFLQYVGAPPGDLATPDLLEVKFDSLESAYAYAETNSGLVRAAQAREKISRASVKAIQADFGPRVDLRGTASYSSVSPFNDQLRTAQLVGQVVVTQQLFDSGLRTARLRDAQEANESDWRLLDSVYRETRDSIGSAWDSLASARTSLANYREAIAAAQRAYEGALIQQKTGDRSTLDVLDLARDLLTVRNNYNITVANEYQARATLLAAAGLLEGPQILPDADAHFNRVDHAYDVPLVTPILAGLDKVTVGNTKADRPSRDTGAQQGLDQSMPLPPATVTTNP